MCAYDRRIEKADCRKIQTEILLANFARGEARGAGSVQQWRGGCHPALP